ncbi:MAG: type II toxin-antitoxin system RelE/ParE family toxin [Planctomycetota bacterium]
MFYADRDGSAPVRDWLEKLREARPRAYAKCVQRIRRLQAHGYELRRPLAGYLGSGIRELRARDGTMNHRLLYFSCGRNTAVLCHALRKEGVVPRSDMWRALRRKRAFERDPETHTHRTELDHG